MPDFAIEHAYTCNQNVHWETTVRGSGGRAYKVSYTRLTPDLENHFGCLYGWTCECHGFMFRRKCRHIDAIKASGERCEWNFMLEPTLEPGENAEGNPCCPECGGDVDVFPVAV